MLGNDSNIEPKDYFTLVEYTMKLISDTRQGSLLSAELLSTFPSSMIDVSGQWSPLTSEITNAVFSNVFPLFPEERVAPHEERLLEALMTRPASSYFAEWLMGPMRQHRVVGVVDLLFVQYYKDVAAKLHLDVEQSLELLRLQLQSHDFELRTDFERVLWIMKINSLAAEAARLPRVPFSSFFNSAHELNKQFAANFSNEILKGVFSRPSKMVRDYVDELAAQVADVQEMKTLIDVVENENSVKNKWELLLELFRQYPLSIKLLDAFPFEKFNIDIDKGVFTQVEACKKGKSHECFSKLVVENPSLKEVDDWIDEFALGKLKYHRTQDEQTIIDATKACMDGTRWTDCTAVCTKAGWSMLVESCSQNSYRFGPGALINTILNDGCGPEWSSTDRVAALKRAGCSFDPYSQLAIFDNIKHLNPRSFPWIKLPSMVSEFYVDHILPVTDEFFLLPYLKQPTSNVDKAHSDNFNFPLNLFDGCFFSYLMITAISRVLEVIQDIFDISKFTDWSELERKKWTLIILVRARIVLNRAIGAMEISVRSSLPDLPKFCEIVA